MKKTALLLGIIILNLSISGCISEEIDDDVIVDPEKYEWEDDGELVIVTYDVYGLTDEMISQFENESGYEVSMMKLDDAGSVLDHLLQHKGLQIADLAIGRKVT